MVEISPSVAVASTYCKYVSGSLSIIGSFLIIYHITRNFEQNIKKTTNRYLIIMSSVDIIQSTFLALGLVCQKRLWSCSLQGFVVIFGSAVPLYNAALSIYYLMTIRYAYDAVKFKKRIEPFCHAFALGAPLTIAIISVSLDLIEPTGQLCTIGDPFLFILSAGLLFVLHISTNIFSMLSIFLYIYTTERHLERHLSQSATHLTIIAARKKLARQASRFVFACLITYSPPLFLFIEVLPVKNMAEIACSVLFPLQGFWNFFIYIAPMVENVRIEDSNISVLQAIKIIIIGSEPTTNTPPRRRVTNLRRRRNSFREENRQFMETPSGAEDNYLGRSTNRMNSILFQLGFLAGSESETISPPRGPTIHAFDSPMRGPPHSAPPF